MVRPKDRLPDSLLLLNPPSNTFAVTDVLEYEAARALDGAVEAALEALEHTALIRPVNIVAISGDASKVAAALVRQPLLRCWAAY